MKPHLLVILQDIGGANAVLPVLAQPALQQDFETVIVAGKYAAKVLTAQGVPFERPEQYGPANGSTAQAMAALARNKPALVLTGTSLGNNIERAVIPCARQRRIPTVAVLDHWVHYRPRFADEADELSFLPDILAVMDELARTEAVVAGLPAERLVITGQPHFDALVTDARQIDRTAAREGLGVASDETLICFASEPQAHDYGAGPDAPNYLGYTEDDVLRLLLTALEKAPIAKPHLIVKLHPRETPERLSAVLEAFPHPGQLLHELPPRELMVAADLVVGMTSMFLIEAAYLGKPVVSVQPGRADADDFIGCKLGLMASAADPQTLFHWLETQENIEPTPPRFTANRKSEKNAAAKVAALIYASLEQPLVSVADNSDQED